MPGLADTCNICRRAFLFSLPRCGTCRKPVCLDCGTRTGGAVFCSKTCSHTFFYGAEEDIEEDSRRGGDPEDE